MLGIETYQVVSTQSADKRPDYAIKAGIATVQRIADRLGDVFVGTVAEHRGVTADAVLSDYGQGGVFNGVDAIDAGLADEIGSFEDCVAALQAPRAA